MISHRIKYQKTITYYQLKNFDFRLVLFDDVHSFLIIHSKK
jgi:hypothetical protein